MVCPFRIELHNEHVEAPNGSLVLKKQTQIYAECLYDECPFWDSYNYNGGACRSIEAQFDE